VWVASDPLATALERDQISATSESMLTVASPIGWPSASNTAPLGLRPPDQQLALPRVGASWGEQVDDCLALLETRKMSAGKPASLARCRLVRTACL
jgi:hypothetical protein